MIISNQIVSYFVDTSIPPNVFSSPVTMNSNVASKIIKKECSIDIQGKQMMHVCFDRESKIIYVPNAQSFTKDKFNACLKASQYYIEKEWGQTRLSPIIEGSPFSSLRLRSISSFKYVCDAIRESFGDDFEDLTVVEANLERMPQTKKGLPSIYNDKNYSGGLITNAVKFIDEIDIRGRKRKNPIQLLTVNPPFILVDTSKESDLLFSQKEWVILSGYRDYIFDKSKNNDSIETFAPLYAAKRHLYLGWSFEELCYVFLRSSKNFEELMKGVENLLLAAKSIVDEGYDDPADYPYYISFKIDPKTFPLDITDLGSQIPFFEVQYYNPKTQIIVIRSSAYIDSELCMRILNSISRPYIVKYNNTMKVIDVKSSKGIHGELLLNSKIPSIIKKKIQQETGNDNVEFRADARARSISKSSNTISHLRRLNEYYYAKDHIKKMCKERGCPFEDIDIVVGPIEKIFGRGVQGGFMGKKEFEKSKLRYPCQIEKGLWISPPIIAVNSDTMPSYASQTETLIHEYSHKLFSISNPFHEHLYNKEKNLRSKDPRKYWALYLGDKDERLAHQEEIRFELLSGKSVDEIVRDKVGGAITVDNYKQSYVTAINFKKMVDEVVEKLEKESV